MARQATRGIIAALLLGMASWAGAPGLCAAQSAYFPPPSQTGPGFWPSPQNPNAPLGPPPEPATGAPEAIFGQPKIGSLDWAAAGDWRIEPERDRWRRPVATLTFFGLQPNMTVLEVWPGAGWYTSILAPYLYRGGGQLIVAHFDPAAGGANQRRAVEAFRARFASDRALFGSPIVSVLSRNAPPPAPDNSVDLVLTFRNVHNWMAAGWADKAFRDFYRVLKPGGVLGVEEHRAAPYGEQDPQARNGYVQVGYMKRLAQDAGFELIGESEINANPADTKDHPFGVWTLPPVLRTSEPGKPANPDFDSSPYRAIGESDRMTLKFRKPLRASDPARPLVAATPVIPSP